MDYFYDLNNYFKTLFYHNRKWFEHRTSLTEKEQKTLFDAFLKMDVPLREVREVFLQKEKTPQHATL